MAASTSTRRTLPPLEVTTTGIPDAEHVVRPPTVVDDASPPGSVDLTSDRPADPTTSTDVWTLPSRGIRDVPWEAGVLLVALFAVAVLFAQRSDAPTQQWVPTPSLFTQSATP